MSFLGETFNVGDTPQSENDFQPIPAGWYNVTVTDAELKDTKAGTGNYIKVRFDVTGPSHEGRVVWTNLNIKNPTPKAEEIGRQQLDSLMRSIGIATVEDTDQLIGGSCTIKVSIRRSEEWGDSNEVKAYKAIDGSSPPMPKSAPASEASDDGAKKAPWQK
jgi:hypothetical protein